MIKLHVCTSINITVQCKTCLVPFMLFLYTSLKMHNILYIKGRNYILLVTYQSYDSLVNNQLSIMEQQCQIPYTLGCDVYLGLVWVEKDHGNFKCYVSITHVHRAVIILCIYHLCFYTVYLLYDIFESK